MEVHTCEIGQSYRGSRFDTFDTWHFGTSAGIAGLLLYIDLEYNMTGCSQECNYMRLIYVLDYCCPYPLP